MILIVDDNKEIRESKLSEYLTNNELECNIAMDAVQVRNVIQKKLRFNYSRYHDAWRRWSKFV